jgi:hypothetical protein
MISEINRVKTENGLGVWHIVHRYFLRRKVTEIRLTSEEEILWKYIRPALLREAPCETDWRGSDYMHSIDQIHAQLQERLARTLVLHGHEQDSNELATIRLPNRNGECSSNLGKYSVTPEDQIYLKAPVVLTFSDLGPVATIRDDVNAEPSMVALVLELLKEHRVDYIPFAATQAVVPKIYDFDGDTDTNTWFDECFSWW